MSTKKQANSYLDAMISYYQKQQSSNLELYNKTGSLIPFIKFSENTETLDVLHNLKYELNIKHN